MGTRSVIARPNGDGFRGRYCHWDGYPSGVGASLWAGYHEKYQTAEAMRSELLSFDSFSTIAGATWALPIAPRPDTNLEACDVCGLAHWRHYRQYYAGQNGNAKAAYDGTATIAPNPDEVQQFDHSYYRAPRPHGCESGPQVGDAGEWIDSDGDDGGTEWAYVLTDSALFIFERRFGSIIEDQGHGTGMFGYGASDTDAGGWWAPVAYCPWNGPEPDWEKLNKGSQVAA